MKSFIKVILFLLTFSSFGQKEKIDSLKYIKQMPYASEIGIDGDKLFWDVVKLKKKAIPFLLEKINDTTKTKAKVVLFGYDYTVADIAYVALEEIIHDIPTFELLGAKFDTNGCGYCAYFKHLNNSYDNRKKFKKDLLKWYNKNKNNLVWFNSNSFSICDCGGTHPNGGYYSVLNGKCKLSDGKYKIIYNKSFSNYPKFEFEVDGQNLTRLNSDKKNSKYTIEYLEKKSFRLKSVEKQKDSLTELQKKLLSEGKPYYEIKNCKKDTIEFTMRINLHVISHSGKFVRIKN